MSEYLKEKKIISLLVLLLFLFGSSLVLVVVSLGGSPEIQVQKRFRTNGISNFIIITV